jgi:DNA-binding NarL/FixJ family response regulator
LGKPPDLLLLDLHLPDIDGFEISRRLRNDHPHLPIVIMTFLPKTQQLKHLLDLNILGYIDKAQLSSGLPAAVKSILDGRMFFSASRSTSVAGSPDPAPTTTRLSPREIQIARMVVRGLPSKQIADHLGLSPSTIKNHRARIMDRLHLANAADLVRWCMDHGIA